jgi:hypothetical protein
MLLAAAPASALECGDTLNDDATLTSGNVAKRIGIHPQCMPQSLCL